MRVSRTEKKAKSPLQRIKKAREKIRQRMRSDRAFAERMREFALELRGGVEQARRVYDDERVFAEKRLREIDERLRQLEGKQGERVEGERRKLEEEKKRVIGEITSIEEFLSRPVSALEKELDIVKRKRMLAYPGLPRDRETGRRVRREKERRVTFGMVRKTPFKVFGIPRSKWVKMRPEIKRQLRREAFRIADEKFLAEVRKRNPLNEKELIQALTEVIGKEPSIHTIRTVGNYLGIPTPFNAMKIREIKAKEREKTKSIMEWKEFLESLVEKAKERGLSSKSEIKEMLREEGIKEVNPRIVNKVLEELNEIKGKELQEEELSLYDIREGSIRRVKKLPPLIDEIARAYFEILEEGKIPTRKEVSLRIGREITASNYSYFGKFLKLFSARSNLSSEKRANIFAEQLRRLEAGEPLLIKKGMKPTLKNAALTLSREGKTQEEIARILGKYASEEKEAEISAVERQAEEKSKKKARKRRESLKGMENDLKYRTHKVFGMSREEWVSLPLEVRRELKRIGFDYAEGKLSEKRFKAKKKELLSEVR